MVNLAVEVAKMLDQVILSGVSLLTNVAGITPVSDKNDDAQFSDFKRLHSLVIFGQVVPEVVQGVVCPQLPELHESLGADLTLILLVGGNLLLLDVWVSRACLVGVLAVHRQRLVSLEGLETGVTPD